MRKRELNLDQLPVMSSIRYWILCIGLVIALQVMAPYRALSLSYNTSVTADTVKKKTIIVIKAAEDSAKKQAAALKTPLDSLKKKTSLLKKLLNALKFTKNSRAKERERIIFLIDSLVLNNPNMITVKNLQDLKLQLTDTTRKQYTELMQRIQQLQKSIVPLAADTIDKEAEQQQNINAVIAKVVPMLKSVENTQNMNLDRQKRIQKIRELYGQSPDKIDTLKLNDSISLVYKLRLKHKKDVLGYSSYQSEQGGVNYNYKILNTLALFAYELNPNTGYVRDLNNQNTDAVFKQAVNSGTNVYLSFFANGNLNTFLSNSASQSNFFTSVIKLLKTNQVGGVNIYFSGLTGASRYRFTNFIQNLYQYCKSNYAGFKLSITVPGIGNSDAYNLQDLDAYTDRFILDFTKFNSGKAGPINPLKGYQNNNIQSAISRFINRGIATNKFYMCLPYHGVRWTFTKTMPRGGSPVYLPYKDIRSHYSTSFYNLDTTTCFSTELRAKNVTDTVWFDDENTLAKKYDFALLSKLGGVAIFNLGDGDGYSELWDALAEKFLDIDTVKIKKIYYRSHIPALTFSEKFKLHYFFFDKPCENYFPDTMANWLGISKKDTISNQLVFNRMLRQTRNVLWVINAVLLLVLVVSCILLIYFIRLKGEWWSWKKPFIGFIIVIVHLFILALFMVLYLDDNIPWFGGSHTDCIDMPFHILISIISVGIITGMLIMRFLIFPFLKKEEIP